MKIKYLGHSSFLLTRSAGAAIVCDPFSAEVGFPMPKVCADIVTASHHHFDHDAVFAVSGNPIVLDGEQNCEKCGVKIQTVHSFHDKCGGKKRGENYIFKFDIDGLTVCHLGDLGEDFSPALAEKIGRVNVLLIPVGGNYTIDAAMAKRYADAIKPDIIIPMHYSVEGCNINIDRVDKFLSLFKGDEGVEIENVKGEIELSPKDICGGKTRLIVMDRSKND